MKKHKPRISEATKLNKQDLIRIIKTDGIRSFYNDKEVYLLYGQFYYFTTNKNDTVHIHQLRRDATEVEW